MRVATLAFALAIAMSIGCDSEPVDGFTTIFSDDLDSRVRLAVEN